MNSDELIKLKRLLFHAKLNYDENSSHEHSGLVRGMATLRIRVRYVLLQGVPNLVPQVSTLGDGGFGGKFGVNNNILTCGAVPSWPGITGSADHCLIVALNESGPVSVWVESVNHTIVV